MSATLSAGGEVRLSLRSLLPMSSRRRRDMRRMHAECGGAALSSKAAKSKIDGEGSPGRGSAPLPTKFGLRARRSVKEGARALEQRYGRRNIFCTLTCPGSTSSAVRAMSEWSARIVERLQQWIRDTASGAAVIWVWELQKRGALHLHAVIAHEDVQLLRRVERRWRRYCYRLLQEVSRWSGVDVFARAEGGTWKDSPRVLRNNARPVRKSIAMYLGKYMSKGSGIANGAPPSRWWSVNRVVRAAMFAYRRSVSVHIHSAEGCRWRFQRLVSFLGDASLWYTTYEQPFDTLASYAVHVLRPTDVEVAWNWIVKQFEAEQSFDHFASMARDIDRQFYDGSLPVLRAVTSGEFV